MSPVQRRNSRRDFLRLTGIAATAATVVACTPGQGGTTPPAATKTEAPPEKAGKYELGKLEGPEVITDAAKYPKSFKEAPELAALAKDGKLPPVEVRIGAEPIVVKPLRAVGKYGGVMRRGTNGSLDVQNFARFGVGPDTMLYYDYLGQKLRPNIAKSWEISPDGRVLTVTLRRMRWSDGEPVSSDDVVFWFEDIASNRTLVAAPLSNMRINGKDVVVRKVDQQTFQLVSPDPNFLLPEVMSAHNVRPSLGGPFYNLQVGGGLIAPAKYLKQFHAKYATQAVVDKQATEAKFNGWVAYFFNRADPTFNADLPVLSPWKVRKGNEVNQSTWIMDRNPYSVWVDTDGNQLPYINSLSHGLVESTEVLNVRALAGEYDVQDRFLDANKLPLFLDPANQQRGNYKVYLDPGQSNDFGLRMNHSYSVDNEIGDLLRTPDFRKAISMGIDRSQFNETFFLGAATEGSYVPLDPNHKYYPGKEAATKWATYDVAAANKLLDGIGLTRKDSAGYRLKKDGTTRVRLDYVTNSTGLLPFVQMGEMLKQQWIKIGIDVNINGLASNLYQQRILGNDFQLVGMTVGSEDLFLAPTLAFPSGPGFGLSNEYSQWFTSGGAQGKEPPKDIKDLMTLWQKGYSASETERLAIGKQWWTQAAETCLLVGVVGNSLGTYGFHFAKNTVENIPGRVVNNTLLGSPRNMLPQTLFFK